MNEIARELIYNLRFDQHTRKHFSIHDWDGRKTCNTVGCIAGTAIAMHCLRIGMSPETDFLSSQHEVDWKAGGLSYSDSGQKILGLPSIQTAQQLFMPALYWLSSDADLHYPKPWTHCSANEMPSLDSIEKMVAWAKALPNNRWNPAHCANALEDVLEKERNYIDWAEAYRGQALEDVV